jgi:hypothetical protein
MNQGRVKGREWDIVRLERIWEGCSRGYKQPGRIRLEPWEMEKIYEDSPMIAENEQTRKGSESGSSPAPSLSSLSRADPPSWRHLPASPASRVLAEGKDTSTLASSAGIGTIHPSCPSYPGSQGTWGYQTFGVDEVDTGTERKRRW